MPISRAPSPDDATSRRAAPRIQRNDSCSTHSHDIAESRESQERRLEKSSVDMHQTRMVHVDPSREAPAQLPDRTDSPQSSGKPFVYDPLPWTDCLYLCR
jgi:hypothetical protein